MIRRDFLKLPIAAAALAAIPRVAVGEPVAERATKGSRVSAQKDRYDEELLIMGGRFDLKVSSRDTGGDVLHLRPADKSPILTSGIYRRRIFSARIGATN